MRSFQHRHGIMRSHYVPVAILLCSLGISSLLACRADNGPKGATASGTPAKAASSDQAQDKLPQPLPEPAAWAAQLAMDLKADDAPSDQAFHYDRFKGICVDAQGHSGLNAGLIGECGDLAAGDYTNHDFTGLNLRGANFSEAKLKGAIFRNADLRGADLLYANWRDAAFTGALVSELTHLPFNAEQAQSLGIVVLNYADLDESFASAMTGAANTTPPPPFSRLQELLALGADLHYKNDAYLKLPFTHLSEKLVSFLVPTWLAVNAPVANGTPLSIVASTPGAAANRIMEYLFSQGADANYLPNDTAQSAFTLTVAASAERDTSGIELLLAHGANINLCNRANTCSNLEIAFHRRSATFAGWLMDKGADGAWTGNVPSLLDLTSDVNIMKKLVEHGAKANQATLWNRKDAPGIRWLVENGADPARVDPHSGETLLFEALRSKNVTLVNLAMPWAKNLVVKDSKGYTSLSYAMADRRFWSAALQLLKEGADYNIRVPYDRYVLSPVALALNYWHELLLPLARRGLNVNEPDPENGITPFAVLVGNGYDNLADLQELIELGGDVNGLTYTSVDDTIGGAVHIWNRKTSVLGAVIASYYCGDLKQKMVDFLLSKGANPLQNVDGLSPLHLAAATGSSYSNYANCAKDYVSLLLDRHANVNELDKGGISPLMYGAGNAAVANLLLDAGASVTAIDAAGNSVPYYIVASAYSCSSKPPARPDWSLLLKRVFAQGAPYPVVSSQRHLTLAHLLANKLNYYAYGDFEGNDGNFQCVDLLFKDFAAQHGDLNAKDDKGNRPITAALRQLMPFFLSNLELTQGRSEVWTQDRATVLDFVKNRLAEGWDPKGDNELDFAERSLAFAYASWNLPLVSLLRQKGVQDFISDPGTASYPTPNNACAAFPNAAGFQATKGGCLSPSGALWSMPSTQDKCVTNANGQLSCSSAGATGQISMDHTHWKNLTAYCEFLSQGGRQDWRVPQFADFARESLLGAWRYSNLTQLPMGESYDKLPQNYPPYEYTLAQMLYDTHTGRFKRWQAVSGDETLTMPMICVAAAPLFPSRQ